MFGVRAANPQSDNWGFRPSSSKMFADLKFLCTIEGRQTSCKYSNARAVPSATLTRAFQLNILFLSSAKCSISCRLPFLTYSKTRRRWPCSTQYPTSGTMFVCLSFDIFVTTSRKLSSSCNDSTALSIFLERLTFPFGKSARYTRPMEPSPTRLSWQKLFVAV
nr:hypothetical protein Iba_chr06bCG1470 [Ipomoea batatas]